jgi:uncharacterized membrane protein
MNTINTITKSLKKLKTEHIIIIVIFLIGIFFVINLYVKNKEGFFNLPWFQPSPKPDIQKQMEETQKKIKEAQAAQAAQMAEIAKRNQNTFKSMFSRK